MKAIIEDKIYDTKKAELVYSYVRKCNGNPVIWMPGYYWTNACNIDLYKSPKGQYFEHNKERNTIELIKTQAAMEIIKKLNPDKYIELFGELEEG